MAYIIQVIAEPQFVRKRTERDLKEELKGNILIPLFFYFQVTNGYGAISVRTIR